MARWLGHAYALSGRTAEAISLLEELVSRMLFALRARWLAWLGEAHLLVGQSERASECAAQALAVSRQQNERGNQAYASRLLGEIAAHADPPDVDQGEDYYHQALALAEELGMRPLVAHCHLGLGTLYQRAGRREQALSEIAMAMEMYRAMDMT